MLTSRVREGDRSGDTVWHERLRMKGFEIRFEDDADDGASGHGEEATGDQAGNEPTGDDSFQHTNAGADEGTGKVTRPGPGIILRESQAKLVGGELPGLAWSRCDIACVDLQGGRVCLTESYAMQQDDAGVAGTTRKELVVMNFA